MDLLAGIDTSTQSTTVVLRRLDDGAMVATASAPHPPTTPPRSEQDSSAWWTALTDAFAGLAEHLHAVRGVSVGGQQHGLVAVDSNGIPVHPAKLWNDTESAQDAETLVAELGAHQWAERFGSVPVAAFTITKLAWLQRTAPEAFSKIDRVMLPHDWLTWRLTGEHVTDRGDSSGTGWWSPSTNAYDIEVLRTLDPNRDWLAALPRLLEPTEAAGVVGSYAASELGISPDGIVGAGTGDNMAAALGLGLRSGEVAISLGTSGTVYGVSPTPTADPTGAVAGFADANGGFLPLVCTLNATKVTDAVARLLAVDLPTLGAMARAASPGADGVVFVPYLDGERTPNRPDATGRVSGIRSDVSREQFARAAFEGVACGLLDGLDALTAAGASLDGRVSLIGGGARSPAYQQVFADLLGRPVTVPDVEEPVATGAAVQAAAVVGNTSISDVIDRWALGGGVRVDPSGNGDPAEVRRRYAEARDRGE